MKNLTWQNPEQLFVAQELINKVKSKCCGIKDKMEISLNIAGILLITNRLKMASNRRFVMAFCKNRMKPFVLLKGVF